MTALVSRIGTRRRAVLGTLAGWAGAALGTLGRSGPGVAGPALCAFGVWEIYHPAGYIVAGAILWLYDRQMPARGQR